MVRETNEYVLGLSERDILCYNEQLDWKAENCYYFSENPLLFLHYTLKEASDELKDTSLLLKCRPDLKGKLNIYFWQHRESIELIKTFEEAQRVGKIDE
jgi:hypothetical protein